MGERTWPVLLAALLRREELSPADTAWAMGEIVAGEATPVQIAAFAVALRAKGETAAEVSGLVEAMLEAAVPVDLAAALGPAAAPGPAGALGPAAARTAVDIVGTGGDRALTVNISTMAALVVAGAGVPVVKHGNRAASSQCGTADLLEHLGLPLDLGPTEVATCVAEAGIGFCFAPRFHAGLRHAAVPRREMGVPTAFNFLGPLTNPARPRAGAIGCADQRMAPIMAEVFARRGDTVLVMRGEDGLDEFTTTSPTRVWAVAGGAVAEVVIDAAELGLRRAEPTELRGGDASRNAQVAHEVLAGEPGPARDVVLVNAAAALVAHERCGQATTSAARSPEADLSDALQAGIERARESIDSGAAADVLARWVRLAQALASPAHPHSSI